MLGPEKKIMDCMILKVCNYFNLLSLKSLLIYYHHLTIVIGTTIERWFYYCQYFVSFVL